MYSTKNIRIAAADDNFICRNTFLQKVQMIPEWQIVFVAEDGEDCMNKLSSLKEHMLPQIVFMDIEMPGINGPQTIAMAKSIYPQIYFIALTVFDEDDKIFEAIKAGACGYLLKHEEHSFLKEAVNNVLDFGGSPMSPAIARKALQLLSKAQGIGKREHGSFPDNISPREKEILQYTVNGWDAKRIALHLSISVLTVRKHIAHIYEKLHVQSKAEVISMVHKNNWLP